MSLSMSKVYTNSYSCINAKPYSTFSYAIPHNQAMEFKEFVRSQLEEIGIDPTELCRHAKDLNQPTVQRILSGETPNPRMATVNKINEAISRARLAYGKPISPYSDTKSTPEGAHQQPIDLNSHPDLREVPRVQFKLSAGVSGYSVEPENGNGKPIFFREDWFSTNGYRPEKLFAVRVSGASMEPSLWEGDLIVVNTADQTPRDGEAFALNYEGELVIKRLRRDAGEWWATSDNADQRRFAPKRCTEDVKIIGRVVYKQSERI